MDTATANLLHPASDVSKLSHKRL